jgi:hypothetical protein
MTPMKASPSSWSHARATVVMSCDTEASRISALEQRRLPAARAHLCEPARGELDTPAAVGRSRDDLVVARERDEGPELVAAPPHLLLRRLCHLASLRPAARQTASGEEKTPCLGLTVALADGETARNGRLITKSCLGGAVTYMYNSTYTRPQPPGHSKSTQARSHRTSPLIQCRLYM